jgi:hypothetical protein
MFTPVVSHVHVLGRGDFGTVAQQDVDGSPEGSICVVVCRTEISCGSAA